MSEISDRYRTLAAEFSRRVEATPAERWDAASPCEGWTARDVLRHVVDSNRSTPGRAGIELAATASVDDDPAAAWRETRDAMQAVLDDPEQAGAEYDGMFGPTTVEATVAQFICFDLLVHGWDIARATGQDETLPADEVHVAYEASLAIGDNLRRPGVCGPEISVPADAPEQDRLLGLLGRSPARR